jgi:hypothetical protein
MIFKDEDSLLDKLIALAGGDLSLVTNALKSNSDGRPKMLSEVISSIKDLMNKNVKVHND